MNIASFLLYCMVVTFTPGPTNVVILSTVHRFGVKKAMNYTYGATIAFGLLLAISAVLNSLLIEVIPRILLVMQMIGSVYMFYLAYQLSKAGSASTTVTHAGTFVSGFLMQFLNPKVVLFTMTVIPSFILPHYTAMPAVTIGVLAVTCIGFAAFLTWVVFGTIFKSFLQNHVKVVNVMMAIFLAYSGVMIWL